MLNPEALIQNFLHLHADTEVKLVATPSTLTTILVLSKSTVYSSLTE